MRRRLATATAVVLLACVASALVVYGPLGFAAAGRVMRLGLVETLSGAGEVRIGDRFADIRFSSPFPSPPMLQATAWTPLGSLSLSIERVDEAGFRIELSEPAPSEVAFGWSALWGARDDVEGARDGGLPGVVRAQAPNGKSFLVSIDAYRADRPVALRIAAAELRRLAVEDEEIARAALDAARDLYNETFTCSWLERVRVRLKGRVKPCPAVGEGTAGRERWAGIDLEDWSVARTGQGLTLTSADAVEAPADWNGAIESWAALTQGSAALDLLTHNNQVLDFLDTLVADGVLSTAAPLTVVHFDTHSDLWVYPDPARHALSEDISDFLNAAILRGLVKEVYWVLPPWTRDEPYREEYWLEELSTATADAYVMGPKTLDISVDRASGGLYFGTQPAGKEGLPVVRYHKVLLSELPDFAGRDDVYLEIDGDYFSNGGFDTSLQGRSDPGRARMLADIAETAQTLRERGLKPRFTSWCLSPLYTMPGDELDQERFFLGVLERLGADDYLVGYAHSEPGGRLPRAINVKRQSPLHRYALKLRHRELLTDDGDRRIDLSDAAERGLARDLAVDALGVQAGEAEVLLARLDREDGLLDGLVSLVDLEYFWALRPPGAPQSMK